MSTDGGQTAGGVSVSGIARQQGERGSGNTVAAPHLRISEAARLTGVSPSTIRVWEASKLVSARRHGRYRRYSVDDLERLKTIAALRRRGFGLPAIREYLVTEQPGSANSRKPPPAAGVGRTLRKARRRRGITLKQAAEASNLSVSHISAVERDLGNISMTALQRLAHAVGLQVSDLFGIHAPPERLVRSGDGPTLVLSDGHVRMQSLSVSAALLQAHIFVAEPGGGSEGAYRHEGEEIVHVIEGEVEFWLDEAEQYVVGAGDSLTFPSTLAHRWRNTLPRRAVMIWVNTPISF